MRRLVPILLFGLACQPHRAPAPPSRPLAQRVLLLSLDGLAAERHLRMLAQRAYAHPQGFSAFAQEGFFVRYALPPNPTLTAVSHATIATGRLPQEHGIVGNRFHLPGTPLGATVSGFDAPWQAEPLWATARRQGKKAGVVTFPGCDGQGPDRQADFFMVYVNAPRAPARWWELPVEEGQVWLSVGLQGEHGREQAQFSLPLVTEEGTGRWLGLAVAGPDQEQLARPGQWFALKVVRPHPDGGQQTVGAWCLLRALDQEGGKVVLYQGGFYALEASPRSFRELVEREAGFWPGPPDDEALRAGLAGEGGLTLSEYRQQLVRFSRFFTSAALAAWRATDVQLLLAYQPIVDEAQHALLLADPRQPGYSEGLAATARWFLDSVYQVADQEVGRLAEALDFSREALVVVSDHGMHPVWAQLNLQNLLVQEGLCALSSDKGRAALDPSCQVWAVQGGGVAHLYLNLAEQDPTGLVASSRRHQLLLRATSALARLTVAGEQALEAVASRQQLPSWGLAHAHSGELVVFATPGVVLGGRPEDGLVGPPPYLGAHGYLNHHRSMAAVWMARGAGVEARVVDRGSLTQVAPFVAQLLGLAYP